MDDADYIREERRRELLWDIEHGNQAERMQAAALALNEFASRDWVVSGSLVTIPTDNQFESNLVHKALESFGAGAYGMEARETYTAVHMDMGLEGVNGRALAALLAAPDGLDPAIVANLDRVVSAHAPRAAIEGDDILTGQLQIERDKPVKPSLNVED